MTINLLKSYEKYELFSNLLFSFLFISFLGGCLFETRSPYSPSWPRTHYVGQTGLELTETPCLPSAGIKSVTHTPNYESSS